MNLWSKTFGRTTTARAIGAVDRVPEVRENAGEYQPLYVYLRRRYATSVVLTFAEIEDLLGFPLPESARLEPKWWSGTNPAAHPSEQAYSWTLANRIATVNMAARSVVFEHKWSQDA